MMRHSLFGRLVFNASFRSLPRLSRDSLPFEIQEEGTASAPHLAFRYVFFFPEKESFFPQGILWGEPGPTLFPLLLEATCLYNTTPFPLEGFENLSSPLLRAVSQPFFSSPSFSSPKWENAPPLWLKELCYAVVPSSFLIHYFPLFPLPERISKNKTQVDCTPLSSFRLKSFPSNFMKRTIYPLPNSTGGPSTLLPGRVSLFLLLQVK